MNSLIIKENTGSQETINLQILNKLYEIAQSNISIDLEGNLFINSPAHQDKINYLMEHNQNLIIQTLNGQYYIDFGDSTVESLLANRYGDGIGVTQIQASAVTEINNYLFSNQNVVKVDLSSFINLRKITSHMFSGCANLQEVIFPQSLVIMQVYNTFSDDRKLRKCIIPGTINEGFGKYCFNECNVLNQLELHLGQNISTIDYATFKNCYEVTFDIDTFQYITKTVGPCFQNCRAVTELNFPSLTTIELSGNGSGFSGCSSLSKINLGHITSMNGGSYFSGCTSLKIIDFGDSITALSSNVVPNDISTVQACIFRTTTPPSCSSTSFGGNANVKIFVPDAAVSTYLATAPFDSFGSSRVLPLSQYVETDYIPAAS